MELSSIPRIAKGFVIDAHTKVTKQVERSKRQSKHFVARTKHRWIPNPIWFFSYPVVIVPGLLFVGFLVMIGRIRIEHRERIPHWVYPLAILSNHPSFVEAYLLPFIFGWRSLWVRLFPYSTPDQGNFSGWWWFFAVIRFILVPRNAPRALAKALAKANRVLRDGFRFIMFVEGMRTQTGIKKGHKLAFDYGNGVRMLRIGKGAARTIYKTETAVLLIFVQGSDMVCPHHKKVPSFWDLLTKVIVITVGPTVRFKKAKMKNWGSRPQIVTRTSAILERKFDRLARECVRERKPYYGFKWDAAIASGEVRC